MRRAVARDVDPGERHAFAFEQSQQTGAAAQVEHRRAAAHVVINPHRARPADIEPIDRVKVVGVEDLAGGITQTIELGQVIDAGKLVSFCFLFVLLNRSRVIQLAATDSLIAERCAIVAFLLEVQTNDVKERLLQYLQCPACGGAIEIESVRNATARRSWKAS